MAAMTAIPAAAQGRDGLLNGAVIGAAVGAAAGVAFTHVVRDSDLVVSQYARGALIFGVIGAGLGAGADALLSRVASRPGTEPRTLRFAPILGPRTAGVGVAWRPRRPP